MRSRGKQLAYLHVGYEQPKEYPLTPRENPDAQLNRRVEKMKLTRDKNRHTKRMKCDPPVGATARRLPSFGRGAVLPEERDEPEAGAQAVFGIAGQLAAEDSFLVEQAQDDAGDEEGKGRPGEIGAERQGNEKPHHDHAEIHGVAHNAVGPGRDDRLAGPDLNDARSEAVNMKHPEHEEVRAKNEDQGKNREPQRHRPQE